MDLLDAVGVRGARSADRDVGQLGELVPPFGGQRNDLHTAGFGLLDRHHHIARIAAGTDCQQHVAFASERLDPTRKNLVETEIVAHAGHVSRVVDRHGRQRTAGASETPGQLFGKMRGIAQRAAVAATDDFTPFIERLFKNCDRLFHQHGRLRVRNELVQRRLRLMQTVFYDSHNYSFIKSAATESAA